MPSTAVSAVPKVCKVLNYVVASHCSLITWCPMAQLVGSCFKIPSLWCNGFLFFHFYFGDCFCEIFRQRLWKQKFENNREKERKYKKEVLVNDLDRFLSLHDAPDTYRPNKEMCEVYYMFCIKLYHKSWEVGREESAEMRQSLLYDPEVATATAPSSQPEEGTSKASPNKNQLK